MTRLFAAIPGLALVPATAAHDLWCRIPDLPSVFATTPETVPATVPYLSPDPALVAIWAARLPTGPGRRAGLVWAGAGRPHDPGAAATDRVRSIPPDQLTPLWSAPVQWISLQKDQVAPQPMFDPMPGVADFADTAAIITALDLVVSVDTAIAHLAASLGKPVLLLDRHDNCWRWLAGRMDSPWYPGVLRILRQPTPGDWQTVLRQAADLIRSNAWLD